MLHQIGSTILKWFGWSMLALLVYSVYMAIVKPIAFRWRYSKYTNVYVSSYFVPFFGDFFFHVKNLLADKMHYVHLRDE